MTDISIMTGIAPTIEHMIDAAARAIIAHASELTELDQAVGDGDHGINMKRGMEAVLAELPKQTGKPPGEMLKAAGMQLVMKVGGASGPIFGTFLMEFGKLLPPNPIRADVVTAFAAATDAVKKRGKADIGQKTLIDVLVPVHEAIASGADPAAIAAAAKAAADATIPLRATRGRASFLGDRSIGHIDPGARSSELIISAICQQLKG